MAADQVQAGLGTKLQVSISSVLTTIALRTKLSGPASKMGTVPTVNLDSVAATSRPTYPNMGDLTGTVWFDPKGTTGVLMAAKVNVTPTPGAALDIWALVFSQGTIWGFSGILKEWTPGGMDPDGNLSADFSIEISGLITVTP
jgi:hypothetical protein